MGFVIEKTFKGNKREVPGNIPVGLWIRKVEEYAVMPDILAIPFFDPRMEILTPVELRRVKAKALIWREIVGEWPKEIAWWWEIRDARRRGDLEYAVELAVASIDAGGTLHCGFERCGARWSADRNGAQRTTSCKLCGHHLIVISDARKEVD